MSVLRRLHNRLRYGPSQKKSRNLKIVLPKRRAAQPDGFLSVSAIFHNEAPYLAEWLEFHRMVGVQHVYLYDNASTDSSLQVLEPYIEERFVTVTPWPFPYRTFEFSAQILANAHALLTFGAKWRWMAFIDVDEFLFPVRERNLIDILQDYTELPSLVVYWALFGYSGHDTQPKGLVIENYTKRAPDLEKPKSIVDPQSVRSVSNAHVFDFDDGDGVGFDENRRFVSRFDGTENRTSNVLRLNHYYTRSREEFESKLRVKNQHTKKRLEKYLGRAELANAATIHDDLILRFVPELKNRLHACGRTSLSGST